MWKEFWATSRSKQTTVQNDKWTTTTTSWRKGYENGLFLCNTTRLRRVHANSAFVQICSEPKENQLGGSISCLFNFVASTSMAYRYWQFLCSTVTDTIQEDGLPFGIKFIFIIATHWSIWLSLIVFARNSFQMESEHSEFPGNPTFQTNFSFNSVWPSRENLASSSLVFWMFFLCKIWQNMCQLMRCIHNTHKRSGDSTWLVVRVRASVWNETNIFVA